MTEGWENCNQDTGFGVFSDEYEELSSGYFRELGFSKKYGITNQNIVCTLHNEKKLHNLYRLLSIISVIKSRRLRGARAHTHTYGRDEECVQNLVGKFSRAENFFSMLFFTTLAALQTIQCWMVGSEINWKRFGIRLSWPNWMKIPSHHLLERTEESHESLSQNKICTKHLPHTDLVLY